MEKIFLVNDYVQILTPLDWQWFKKNMPVLSSNAATIGLQRAASYDGGTKFFYELEGEQLDTAIAFMLEAVKKIDTNTLSEMLESIIANATKYAKKHERLFSTYEDFARGRTHRIHCFHLQPEPRTVYGLISNEVKWQMIEQLEHSLKVGSVISISDISIKTDLKEYLEMIRTWYQTFNGMNDYCDDMGICFGYEDTVPVA